MKIFNLATIKQSIKRRRIQVKSKKRQDEYNQKKAWILDALISKKITKESIRLADEVFTAYYEHLRKRHDEKILKAQLIENHLVINNKF